MTSERQVEDFQAGRGVVIRWEAIRRQNHWFDCMYLSGAAGHLAGVRLIEEERPTPAPRSIQAGPGFVTPEGQPYLATER